MLTYFFLVKNSNKCTVAMPSLLPIIWHLKRGWLNQQKAESSGGVFTHTCDSKACAQLGLSTGHLHMASQCGLRFSQHGAWIPRGRECLQSKHSREIESEAARSFLIQPQKSHNLTPADCSDWSTHPRRENIDSYLSMGEGLKNLWQFKKHTRERAIVQWCKQ